jgi:hypothetical protein
MKVSNNMQAAREALARRFHMGFGGGAECVAILDRLRFLVSKTPTSALKNLPNVISDQNHRVKPASSSSFYAYGRVHWFLRTDSRMKFYVELDRQHGYLAPFTITAIADDKTGLLPSEVFPILAAAPTAKLTMAELAFDFSPLSIVTRDFVRRHGVFGKSWRDRDTQNPAGDWWGAKNGGKRVKSYSKDEVCAHRVELEMHSRFLKHYGIESIQDFTRLVRLLPRRHILFARLSRQRLIKRLGRSDVKGPMTKEIPQKVAAMQGDLSATLSYLRRDCPKTSLCWTQFKNGRRCGQPNRMDGGEIKMDTHEDIERCFEFVRDGMWDSFLTLKYPREIGPKYTANRYEDSEDAFAVWIDELASVHGGSGISYVRVIEKRENGDVLFHVLLRDVPEGFWQRHWKWRWYELCAGSAWDRRLDVGIERLIKYFFSRVRCDVEYSINGFETYCRAQEHAE